MIKKELGRAIFVLKREKEMAEKVLGFQGKWHIPRCGYRKAIEETVKEFERAIEILEEKNG